jgi:nitroimidazol reductase NimA-like FMN-containing flavoprotein (pyridoxamine 5'-phosphate oxidase superfamily)
VQTTDEDRFLEILDEAQCRGLLTTTTIGRLAFTEGALPAILPASFTLEDGHVLLAVSSANSVVDAVRRAVVAFQVDEFNPVAMTGWSVTVVGPSRIILDPREAATLTRLPGATRLAHPARCYVTVELSLVRGWRMVSIR